jgi:hypothetical protein
MSSKWERRHRVLRCPAGVEGTICREDVAPVVVHGLPNAAANIGEPAGDAEAQTAAMGHLGQSVVRLYRLPAFDDSLTRQRYILRSP